RRDRGCRAGPHRRQSHPRAADGARHCRARGDHRGQRGGRGLRAGPGRAGARPPAAAAAVLVGVFVRWSVLHGFHLLGQLVVGVVVQCRLLLWWWLIFGRRFVLRPRLLLVRGRLVVG